MSVTSTIVRPETRPTAAWWAIPAGFAGGVVLGIVARGWMRLISDDPEFSWGGTLFIVGAFALFGLGQATAWAARRSGSRRRTITLLRAGAIILTLPMFTGAGSIMLPTVVAASLAAWRTDWQRVVRAVLAVVAAPAAVFVISEIGGEFGWGPSTLVRIALFAGIYAVVVVALRPSVAPLADGWRVPRWIRIGSVVLVAAFAVRIVLAIAAALL